MDEPILGLDANHREILYREILANYAEEPKTIVLSTHLIEEAADLLEEVIVIKEGQTAVLSLVGLAVTMGTCNFVLDSILGRLASYTGLFEEIYQAGAAAEILWTAALLTFFASVGWLVTLLYYRSPALSVRR
ncbi:MAG: hypothetical protein GX251_08320 [Firmicutes bacterium]|nr:hypothetical protein [Bacillota bacterium]